MAPQILTPSLLKSIRSHPRLPQHTWYFIAGVTLSVLNRPDEIPHVFRYALEKGGGNPCMSSSNNNNINDDDANKAAGSSNMANGTASSDIQEDSNSTSKGGRAPQPPDEEEQLKIARRLREALVKSSAVIGLPKTINALLALKPSTPAALLDAPLSYTPSNRSIDLSSTPSSLVLQRGGRLFDQIYGKISSRVMGQMDNSGTEDLGLTARVAYGYILSGGEAILSARDTSFVLLAALVPQDVNPQLKGHLKGAVNNGASVDEVRAVREVVVEVCRAAGMKRLADDDVGGWGWRGDVANL